MAANRGGMRLNPWLFYNSHPISVFVESIKKVLQPVKPTTGLVALDAFFGNDIELATRPMGHSYKFRIQHFAGRTDISGNKDINHSFQTTDSDTTETKQ